MTQQSVSSAGAEVLFKTDPAVEASQAGIEYAHRVLPGFAVSQAGVEFLHRVTPAFAISQAGVEVLQKAMPCNSRWAQIWIITRTDGEVLRFTSLDRDLDYGGHTYEACNSMTPSASENMAELSAAGNIELTGLIASGAIRQRDLHAGIYDNARVEAFLVNWDGPSIKKPLLVGTFGNVEYSDNTFSAEVMGDGARLNQTPLVNTIEPNCSWIFGDANCEKDLGPLTVTGTVTTAFGQRAFTDDTRAETVGYFKRGRVTFTSGANEGISAEIKDHEAGGKFTLWPRLAFNIEAGDEYTMTPGCTNRFESDGGCNGCDAWANFDNYGGFRDVPGRDAITDRPDVKN